jgi:hypothetical protein
MTPYEELLDMHKRMEELKKEIEVKEKEIQLFEYREAAELAHDTLCRWNHTDGCGWEYEKDRVNPWGEWAHDDWHTRVVKYCNTYGVDVATLTAELKAIKPYAQIIKHL